MAVQPVRTLGNLNAIVQEALAALSRTFDLLDRTPTITEQPHAPALNVRAATVRFEGVDFRYGEGSAGLHGVNFSAEGGRTTAIVGPSGAGKSTILALLPRLYDVDRGCISIDGVDIRSVTLASLRDAVAVVAQDNTLFDDTIAANIAHGRPGAERAAIEAAARAAFADDFIREMPDGYDTRVGERGTRLSGGERQRIALARAFLKDAPILVLDEATSALDARAEAAVQQALTRLMEGRTTIVVAHRLQTIRSAHHIVVLDQGRVVEQGNHDALIAGGGLYQRLCAQQFEGA
jgi:subfamily B ATP-binding cassette protein MsbA